MNSKWILQLKMVGRLMTIVVVLLICLIVLFSLRKNVQVDDTNRGKIAQKISYKAERASQEMLKTKKDPLRKSQPIQWHSSGDLSDPRVYIKQDWTDFSSDYIQQNINKEDLPLLHKMLENDKYRSYWPKISAIIGSISDDPKSVTLLVEYIKRDDCDYLSDDMLWQKFAVLMAVGQIGGKTAKDVLLDAITEQGAVDLTEDWITSKRIIEVFRSKDRAMEIFRSMGIHGLVLLGEPNTNDLIKQLYEEAIIHYESTGSKVPLHGALVDARVNMAYIEDFGLEEFYKLHPNDHTIKHSYRLKYSPTARKLGESAQKIRDELEPFK